MIISQNLNRIDRLLRGIIGTVSLGFVFLNGDFILEPIIEGLIGIFGLINFFAMVSGWCPVYQVAGISTRD